MGAVGCMVKQLQLDETTLAVMELMQRHNLTRSVDFYLQRYISLIRSVDFYLQRYNSLSGSRSYDCRRLQARSTRM